MDNSHKSIYDVLLSPMYAFLIIINKNDPWQNSTYDLNYVVLIPFSKLSQGLLCFSMTLINEYCVNKIH